MLGKLRRKASSASFPFTHHNWLALLLSISIAFLAHTSAGAPAHVLVLCVADQTLAAMLGILGWESSGARFPFAHHHWPVLLLSISISFLAHTSASAPAHLVMLGMADQALAATLGIPGWESSGARFPFAHHHWPVLLLSISISFLAHTSASAPAHLVMLGMADQALAAMLGKLRREASSARFAFTHHHRLARLLPSSISFLTHASAGATKKPWMVHVADQTLGAQPGMLWADA
mmetsp:Transcript_116323/g.301554  ORF Transcript_116323/g.301554 Transcript_116323/m.301554 type:complete len:234 (-) Transcript_116323:341-1042(-)